MISQSCKSIAENCIDSEFIFDSLTLFRIGPFLKLPPSQLRSSCGAKFSFGEDISSLFPFINAAIEDSQYSTTPQFIRFLLDDHLCALYPGEGAFTPVSNHIEAVDFLQTLITFLKKTADNSSKITPSYREYSPLSPIDIFKLLPGSNCRECGYETCLAFAATVARQRTSFIKCPYLKNPIEEKSIFEIPDTSGKNSQKVVLNINTNILRKEVVKKDAHIQSLQERLAEFEKAQDQNIAKANDQLLSPLTSREIEVLQLLVQGATNKQISKQLYISDHTVKTHINHIFDKLEVNDRTQASVWAVRNGL